MDKGRRNHKITILSSVIFSLKQTWFLLLLLVTRDFGGYKAVIIAAGLLLFFLIGYVNWRNTYFYIDSDRLHYMKGTVNKKNTAVPISAISTVDFSQNVLQRLFGVVSIKVDSGANNLKDSEMSIVLGKAEAEELRGRLKRSDAEAVDIGLEQPVETGNILVKMTPRKVFTYSLTQNNLPVVIGAVLSLLNFADDIKEVTGLDMTRFFEEQNLFQNAGFSLDFLIGIGCLILGGLAASALFSLIYYALKFGNFTAVKEGQNIYIEYGLVSIKKYSFTLDKINAVIAKQNMLRSFLGLYKLHVSIIGYGDDKGEEAVISPICGNDEIVRLLEVINPALKFEGEAYSVTAAGRRNFFILPLGAALAVSAAGMLLTKFGFWWLLLLPATFLVRYLKCKNTSLGYNDKMLVATTGIFSRQTILLEMAKLQSITKKTNYFQRMKKLCTYRLQYYSQTFGGNVTLKHLEDKHFSILKGILFE